MKRPVFSSNIKSTKTVRLVHKPRPPRLHKESEKGFLQAITRRMSSRKNVHATIGKDRYRHGNIEPTGPLVNVAQPISKQPAREYRGTPSHPNRNSKHNEITISDTCNISNGTPPLPGVLQKEDRRRIEVRKAVFTPLRFAIKEKNTNCIARNAIADGRRDEYSDTPSKKGRRWQRWPSRGKEAYKLCRYHNSPEVSSYHSLT